MSGRTGKGFLLTVVASLALMLVSGPATASATTRYVSPNGPPTPAADCLTPATACALDGATSNPFPGDELVLLPGDYMVGNQQLTALNSANIHGMVGEPRPRIFSTYGFAAWSFGNDADNFTVRHLEIYTTGVVALSVSGTGASTVEDVVTNATPTANGVGCQPAVGMAGSVTITNSICRGGHTGLGATCICGGAPTVAVRNVTAIGGTYGISQSSPQGAGSPTDYTVTATNVIARHTGMTGADVRAEGGTAGADVAINLANSNYATQQEDASGGGTATVTDPGSGTNQTGAPLFVDAAGGDFHQAAGSPTIGAGANDPANGTADIDGQQREIGTVDIGADERGRDPTNSVSCTPGSTPPAMFVMCIGTVTDGGASPTVPTGLLTFSSDGMGAFGSPSCTLAPTAAPGQSACSVSYLPSQVGTHQITATSFRDLTHEGSQGAFALAVTAPFTTQTAPAPARKRKCKRKKRRGGKKCKKKRR